ncbi:MAG: hypothetical protein ACXAE3_09270 [Candidatus Kariarchaeaceae archaeon]|jgi:hypothetical protein
MRSLALDDSVFKHPTPLRIFLYAKQQNGTIGLRELQREFNIRNISTVAWHVDKLVDAGYLEKTKDNRYNLSEEAAELNEVDLPVKYPVKILYGLLMPKFTLWMGFGLAGFLVYLFLLFSARHPLTTDIVGLLLISTMVLGNLFQWLSYKRGIDATLKEEE